MPYSARRSALSPCGRCLRILPALAVALSLALPFPRAATAAALLLPPPIDRFIDVLLGYPPNLAPGNSLDEPQRPQIRRAQLKTPQNIMPVFLGIPYRVDGIINDDGQYATFNSPDVALTTPGLNCSGLVLAASRIMLERNIPVAEAVRDRLGDSGPGAPNGHDWDFGFDLIMNISEGLPRAFLVPGKLLATSKATGKTAPSFDPHSSGFSAELLPHIWENGFYLVSFSRHKTPDAPAHLHYHTGVIVRDADAVWLYSTTSNSRKVIRHNLATPEGLERFRNSFKNTAGSYKRLTIIALLP